MRRMSIHGIVLVLTLSLFGCPSKKEGAIEGTVLPPAAGIRVAAVQNGNPSASSDVNAQTGKFLLPLPAGTYEVRVTTPSSPFPLVLPGVSVMPGETTTLAPISLAAPKGNGAITGRVQPAGPGSRITLISEGVERASIAASSEGKYEFEGLPAGQYTLQTAAPGYANDSATIVVADDRKAAQDIRMLYITAIEGVDWSTGKVRARGIGLPPKQAPTPTVRRELAKRAALVDAERNMVRILELINVAPGQPLTSAVGEANFSQKLSGYLQGYRIAIERDMDGGKIEVEIELPLTGPGGLTSYLHR